MMKKIKEVLQIHLKIKEKKTKKVQFLIEIKK